MLCKFGLLQPFSTNDFRGSHFVYRRFGMYIVLSPSLVNVLFCFTRAQLSCPEHYLVLQDKRQKEVIMRIIITMFTIALGLLSSGVFANHSDINLKSFDNGNISVFLDGNSLGDACNEFNMLQVPEGRHHLRVLRHHNQPYAWWGSYPTTVFNGYIDVPGGYQMFVEIDRFNRFNVYDQINVGGFQEPVTCQFGCDGSCGRFNCPQNCVIPCRQPQNNDHNPNTWWDQSCSASHMTQHDFRHLMRAIGSKWFDSSKSAVARHAIEENHFSAFEIREILMMMNHESTRLELAKFAYVHTCDHARFFQVFNVFHHRSSIRSLERFMRNH